MGYHTPRVLSLEDSYDIQAILARGKSSCQLCLGLKKESIIKKKTRAKKVSFSKENQVAKIKVNLSYGVLDFFHRILKYPIRASL
jgi:hypothetical protein